MWFKAVPGTAALTGQAEPVLVEEKQPCLQITGRSGVIFKQNKGGLYSTVSGLQGLGAQKENLHPDKNNG